MKKNKLFFGFGFMTTIALGIFFGLNLNAKEANKTTNDEQSRIDALIKLTKTISTIESFYVDKLSLKQIVDKTIAGLMSNLDAHSSFMNEKDFKETMIQTSGEFGGLGIVVGIKDGALTVISPIDDTPAQKAGLKANDVILRIDGNVTLGMSADEAVSKMRGKPKTKVALTIVRKGEIKPFDVNITRDIIKTKSVYAKNIENENILYLRVTNFDKHVTPMAAKFIKENPNVKGIILDLRNNPGGLLDQAIGLTNLFVDNGIIVSQKGRSKEESKEYKAAKENKITSLPLVVLINGGSASASEIVSGSLQDNKRAVLVGENTFGKGSVQVVLPINTKEALRLTVARYYLPKGRSIQAVGVVPDLLVHPGKVPLEDSDVISLKESDLKKHLKEELNKIEPKKTDKKIENKDKNSSKTKKDKEELIAQSQINDDIQLKTAIDAIKVLNIGK